MTAQPTRDQLRAHLRRLIAAWDGPGNPSVSTADLARLLDQLDQAEARIKAVRELHQHGGAMFDERLEDHTHVCASCLEEWPCPTIRALDGDA